MKKSVPYIITITQEYYRNKRDSIKKVLSE